MYENTNTLKTEYSRRSPGGVIVNAEHKAQVRSWAKRAQRRHQRHTVTSQLRAGRWDSM